MSALSSCPFCHHEVTPARGPSGALVCPLCHNTGDAGKTDRLAAGDLRTLEDFERRIVAHLGDVQAAVTRMAHDPRTDDNEARLDALEHALEQVRERSEATETAVSIRLAELAANKSLDGLIQGIEALRADIEHLHDAYERTNVPALRQELRALARSVRDLEQERYGRREPAAFEWERPEPETLDEADTPLVRGRFVAADEPPTSENGSTQEEDPLVAAAAANGHAPGRRNPPDDFSGVPPVMDTEKPSMRDLVAQDAVRMPPADQQPEPAGQDPLAHIESALHDIDQRLRQLRER